MKKLLHIVLLSTLFCSFTARTSAKVADVTELFGEWTYTATVSYADGVTEAQKANIKETGTAIISQPSVSGFGCQVTGFLGTTAPFLCDFSANTLTCKNPNSGNGVFSIGSWALSDGATKYPWMGNFSNWEWTVSDDGKTITISTFYIVSCNHPNSSATAVATVTNATLTFSKAEEVEAIDLTGDWKFTATQYYDAEAERFPHEFDMKLTAKDQTYKTYNATLDFGEEYTEQTFNDVTFNGVTVTIPLGSKRYLNDSLSLAQMSENNILFDDGVITFDKTDSRTLSLSSRLDIRMDTTIIEEGQSHETTKFIQYYNGGTAKKAVSYSFAGTYVVTVDDEGLMPMPDDNTSGFEYPKSFEFTIISGSNPYIGDYLTFSNFMGADIYVNYMLRISENNPYVLELPTGQNTTVYKVGDGWLSLYDGNGETKNPVTITYNEEDGTLSISDFSFAYCKIPDPGFIGVEAYYTNATIVKKGEEAPEKWDYLGDYTMTATVAKEAAAADYADFDFAESSKFTVELFMGKEPTVVSTFMNANASGLNSGGFLVTVDEQAKTLSFNGGLVYYNNGTGKQLNLRDVTGGMNPIVVTYNEDGTITMSDFTIVDIEGNRVATCTGVTLTRGTEPEAPFEYLGDYTMNATVAKEAAATDFADFDFAESSKFTVELFMGKEPTVVSTFMNANASGLNSGGFLVTVDEQAKTLSFNGGLVYYNNGTGKQLSLRDAEQGMNPIVVTYNEDGTITMSDFTIVDGEGNLVAACTGVTLTRGYTPEPGAIESVSSDRKAAVYAADGVIYIAGEPTRVEVYSISGAQEYSGITNEIGGLNRGFYLVKANGSTSKVIVR